MNPYLLIIDQETLTTDASFLQILETDSPVDVLVITDKEGENQTYQYLNPNELKAFFETTAEDYETILLANTVILKSINEANLKVDGYFNIAKNELFLLNELSEDTLRYFHCKEIAIFYEGKRLNIKGLTLGEFENLTKCICLNHRPELDQLLRSEAPIYCQFNYPATPLTHFIKNSPDIGVKAILSLASKEGHELSQNGLIQHFFFLKPHIELWVFARPFATLGSLNFDLNKVIKEAKVGREAIASCVLSTECPGTESVFSFTEAFAINNELELNLNMDTMREELESIAQSNGCRIIADRVSKTSRIILVDKEKA